MALFAAVWLVIGAVVGAARTLARHAPAVWGLGLSTLGVAAGGPFAAGGAIVFFEVVPPTVWFAHVLAVAVVTAALAAGRRWVSDPSGGVVAGSLVAGYGFALVGVPGVTLPGGLRTPELVPSLAELVLRSSPVLPTRAVTYALTLALPAGVVTYAAVGRLELGEHLGRQRLPAAAGAAAVVVPVGGAAVLGAATDVAVASWLVVLLSTVVPVGYFAGTRGTHPEREGTEGLLLPAVVIGGAVLGALLVDALEYAGPASWLDWQFLTSLPSPFPEKAGFYPALVGSLLLMLVVVVLAFPLGVGAAVYLEEYAPDNRVTRFIQVNIANLAGVPSVVYGLLGLGLFINLLNLGIGSVLVGGITLSLLILPIVIISSQEAIRSVPDEYRQASYGMGATRYQTVRNVVLPEAFPGILTGTILAIGRAIGETAPLIMIGAANVTFSIPTKLSDSVSAMPMQVFTWATSAKLAFQDSVLAAGVVTMVVVLLVINSVAIVLRNTYQTES
ncbi:MAG: phosphate ABC transporter permease PstA [Halobacteriaceae archaeon]